MRKTTGLSLLLLIFLSLALIIFSLLSYSGAAADAKLSQKAADHTTEYYQIISKANEILAFIDEQLFLFLEKNNESVGSGAEDSAESLMLQNIWGQIRTFIHSDSDFSEALSTMFPAFSFSIEENSETLLLHFEVFTQTDAAQVLQVTLKFTPPDNLEQTLYQITRWQIVTTQEWTPEQSQNLMRLTE